MTKCYWPWFGAVIDPQGYIVPCCIMNGNTLLSSGYYDAQDSHIDKIDSLSEYLLSDFAIYIRNKLKKDGIHGTEECNTCSRAIKRDQIYHPVHSRRFKNNSFDGHIRYLEVTASNICNQTCITCNSYYSTKWLEIQDLFSHIKSDGMKYNLSDNAIDKIIEVFPNLQEFVIKGGEPFSDLRNAKMLEKLLDVNPTCRIHITSNVSLVSKKYLDILKKAKNPDQIRLHGSLDHIGKKYEWIRGTSFNQTLMTIKRIYEETGIKTQPSPTLSYFNILDLKEIKDFYMEYPYTEWFKNRFDEYNYVYFPMQMDPIYTRTQEELDTVYESGMSEKRIISEFNSSLHEQLFNTINIMNKIRGFDWQDVASIKYDDILEAF
jgi:MoaA/NifB/PqqE/SkfB family radical SAM enzyme